MGASRIQGITVEIGGDTTKLTAALKGVNGEIRTTQSELRDVNNLLKLDSGNTELLAQKHRLLAEAVRETKEKLETLKAAAEQANEALAKGEITQEQYDGLQRENIETEERMKSLEEQANQSAVAVQKIAADFDSAMSQVGAVSGATGSELEALRDKVREMGAKTKFSASEAAEAMNYMAMAGWKNSDMLSGMPNGGTLTMSGAAESFTAFCFYNNGNAQSEPTTVPASPYTRKNMSFCGWSIDSLSTSAYKPGEKGVFPAGATLYAVWVTTEYDFVYTGSYVQFTIYADEGISGVSTNRREQFKKMIKDCEDGKIEIKLA